MKFGCNYSSILMDLIASSQADVDAVKMGYFGPFSGLHDMVARRRKVLIHGFGWHEHIGMVSPETGNDWELMNRTLETYDNDTLAVHFSVYEQEMSGRGAPRTVLEEGIKVFKEHMNVPLMIENMDHNPMYNRKCVLKEAVDPEFIHEMCDKYDLYMLLDTAHASVSAWHMNMDIHDYLRKLPLDRVKEVHFVGSHMTDDQGLKDMHTPLEEQDFVLMDWLMERMKPEMITLEYGWPGSEYQWRTDEGQIIRQLSEIRKRYSNTSRDGRMMAKDLGR